MSDRLDLFFTGRPDSVYLPPSINISAKLERSVCAMSLNKGKEPQPLGCGLLDFRAEETLRFLLVVVFGLVVILRGWPIVILLIDNSHRFFRWSLIFILPFLSKGSYRKAAEHRDYHQISD